MSKATASPRPSPAEWEALTHKYRFLPDQQFARLIGTKTCLHLYPSGILAVKSPQGLLFPEFQVNKQSKSIYPAIPGLIRLLSELNRSHKSRSDADLIYWLLTPSPTMDNQRPVAYLDKAAELLKAAKQALNFEW